MSRQAHPDVYLEVLDYAQQHTWRIDFSTYERALTMLKDTGAFEEEDAQSASRRYPRPVAMSDRPPGCGCRR